MDGDSEVGRHGIQVLFWSTPGASRRASWTVQSLGALGNKADGVPQLGADEPPIEGNVVGHEDPAFQPIEESSATSSKKGACFTISSVIPVKLGDPGRDLPLPGFTRVWKSSEMRPSLISTTAISVIRWPLSGEPPVVSTSTTA